MNIFKKKYKRSEWFEGLLWAEAQPRKELNAKILSGSGLTLRFNEEGMGIYDYYLYRQRVLDVVNDKINFQNT